MALPINVVRINGYKDGRRTHIDIEVPMHKIEYDSAGKHYSIDVPRVPHFSDIPELGFKQGLEAVTSYNYYNWCGKNRYTSKIV